MLGSRGIWRKIKSIGKGSFGQVYLVRRNNDTSSKMFVMKEVRLAGLPPKELSAAKAEVAALKKVSHPHIIKYEDSLVQDETLCIVMEYAAGKDLSALIAKRKQENKPLEEKEVLKIFYQVCSALSYCHHDLKMLHRDLKPQNIFLTADGDVKLGDFGLAKCVEATCALAQTQCGTPVYMSPELCMGDSYNRAADVWALGCVLYELMTLSCPWHDIQYNKAGGMAALLKRIATSTLDLSVCYKRYSSELCSLLGSLLHKKGVCRPALNNVLLLDVMASVAPPEQQEDSDDEDEPAGSEQPHERKLPPNWRKVPSTSRKGEYSYVHLPTGFKQADFPLTDEPSAEDLEAARTAAAQLKDATPKNTAAAAAMAARHAAAAARWGAFPKDFAPPPSTPSAAVAAKPEVVQTYQPLPANWKRVPSQSRPGEFSYLHVPTGFKQTAVPTSDQPDPEMYKQWQKAMASRNIKPPPTAEQQPAAGQKNNFRPWAAGPQRPALEPVVEISDAPPSASPRPPSSAAERKRPASGGADENRNKLNVIKPPPSQLPPVVNLQAQAHAAQYAAAAQAVNGGLRKIFTPNQAVDGRPTQAAAGRPSHQWRMNLITPPGQAAQAPLMRAGRQNVLAQPKGSEAYQHARRAGVLY